MIWFSDPYEPPEPACDTRPQHAVAQLRESFNLSQHAAAEALDISRSQLASAETGHRELMHTLDDVRRAFERYTANRERDRELMRRIIEGRP